MDHYSKIKTLHHDVIDPFTELFEGKSLQWKNVKITPRSVFSKVIGYSIRELKRDNVDAVLLIGEEDCIETVLKCANVLQSKFKGQLHQCNAEREKVIEDIWMPTTNDGDCMDLFSAKTFIPVLFVLLSKNDMHLSLGATTIPDGVVANERTNGPKNKANGSNRRTNNRNRGNAPKGRPNNAQNGDSRGSNGDSNASNGRTHAPRPRNHRKKNKPSADEPRS